MTTPVQCTLPPSPGDCRVSVISAHSEKGAALRNSMPFLWIITESGERDKRVCRASTVTSWNEPVASTFLALIQQDQNTTRLKFVKLKKAQWQNKAYHSMTAAPQVNPAPKTTIKIKSPR